MQARRANSSEDFRPSASLDMMRMRADLLRRVRSFFDLRAFLEVETPLLSADTVIDRHLDPLAVTLFDDPRQPANGRQMWLQTSPEFAMKRMLAAGATAIYQVTHAFRGAESGALHNPEFTIVEWYRAGDRLSEGMHLLADFTEQLLPFGRPHLITYREAFLRHANLDPHLASIEDLVQRIEQAGIVISTVSDLDRDTLLDLLLVGCVEPHLGQHEPVIVYDYPASQAALAVVRDENPPVAERFELYVNGIELANGYHELLDPDQLRKRNQTNNALRRQDDKPVLPEHSRMLLAMESGLPACAGVALGFDRLVMVATGADDISQVIAFPIDRA